MVLIVAMVILAVGLFVLGYRSKGWRAAICAVLCWVVCIIPSIVELQLNKYTSVVLALFGGAGYTIIMLRVLIAREQRMDQFSTPDGDTDD